MSLLKRIQIIRILSYTHHFSIENYKRPKAEVDTLMNLARDKFRRLIGEADRFAEAGVRVKVLGNVSLLPQDLRDLIGLATNKILLC